MKNFKSKFFYFFMYLLGIAQVFAAPHPPSPTGKGGLPPPPPGLTVDHGIIFLFILAILLGVYIINKLETKQKTPFI
jgi:hypothetical protein